MPIILTLGPPLPAPSAPDTAPVTGPNTDPTAAPTPPGAETTDADPGPAPPSGEARAASPGHEAHFAALGPGLLARVRPEIVATPLIGHGFDALDVLAQLAEAGWHGVLRVHAPRLPAVHLLAEELREEAARLSDAIDVEIEILG
ncbi:hypothetical protein [Acidimangrovimonas sediminis]|uniref:hypothetical protein n=1 Tax=Acidimangrovimonas sediminis TaxID=2056283 RepID=UPI000C7FE5E9|nr:hypothetical protein [Acidimangrovimonas sediminis]